MVLIIVSTPHLYRIDPPKNLKKEVDQKFWLKRECLARRVGSFWKVGSIPESCISDIVNVWNTKNKFFSAFFKNEYSQLTFLITLIYTMLSMIIFVKITMHVVLTIYKLLLSTCFNLFTPTCLNLVQYTFEPCESSI